MTILQDRVQPKLLDEACIIRLSVWFLCVLPLTMEVLVYDILQAVYSVQVKHHLLYNQSAFADEIARRQW